MGLLERSYANKYQLIDIGGNIRKWGSDSSVYGLRVEQVVEDFEVAMQEI